jgi:hypothetical protein
MRSIKFVAIAATLAASFGAFADGATYEYPQPTTSTLTRAEVRADLDAARSMGMLASGEASYVAPIGGRPLSRGEVRAELAAAQANNELSSGERAYIAESHERRSGASFSQAAPARAAN